LLHPSNTCHSERSAGGPVGGAQSKNPVAYLKGDRRISDFI
jgi:hypothetical protein